MAALFREHGSNVWFDREAADLLPQGFVCPKCGKGRMLERKSAKGRIYYGCERYPDCDFMTWDMPVAVKCEKCGSTLFRKAPSSTAQKRAVTSRCRCRRRAIKREAGLPSWIEHFPVRTSQALRAKAGLRLPASASLLLTSCWPLPQQLLPRFRHWRRSSLLPLKRGALGMAERSELQK